MFKKYFIIMFTKCHIVIIVAYCKKSDIFVCLHRNDEFPYEHSKPIPNIESVLSEKESPLKIQLHEQDIIRYKQKPPCPEDLSKILYTNMQDLRPTIRKIKKEKIFIRDHL
ncbi:unnamed protein product [Gordionus sp. m RMFG-2023]|uniref:large ribosomal subunit protein mL42-like isoform X2 n=1 Tax=Gordionus sp. m RMFG-2023 TaxID=3053472 RepID=UPI0030DFD7FC